MLMKFTTQVLKISLLLLSLLAATSAFSAKKLSSKAEISLLTCSPGAELYSQFGHSALRVNDPENNLDIVFNYGTFDFNTPNFYTKFARGKLKYMLSYSSFERFKREYVYEKRGIIEQTLNLDSISKQKLFNALLVNYQPENRFYSYDFLFDNCSTRIRDIVEANANGHVKFVDTTDEKRTFWNLLDIYLNHSRWIYTGIHLALGMPCDVEATPYQYMFLPDNMMYAFENAQIEKKDNHVPLVKSTKTILEPQTNFITTVWYKRPGFLFGLLALAGLILSILFYRNKRNMFLFDLFLFGASGLLGWLIIFLWFFTDHQATGPNLSILWAVPLHFPFIFLILKKKSTFAYYYFLINSILLLIVIGFWKWIPQSFPNEILPLVVLLLIRSIYIVKKLKTKLV